MGQPTINALRAVAVATAVLLTGWGPGGTELRAQDYSYSTGDALIVGERDDGAYLGVRLVEEIEHSEGGARVEHVVADSPAEAAGLREGDIVVEFDGEVIRGPVALTRRIHAAEPGDQVTLGLLRDGARQRLEVELGQRAEFAGGVPGVVWPSDRWDEWQDALEDRMENLGERLGKTYFTLPDRPDAVVPFSFGWGRPKLGVQLVETTVELREHLGGSDSEGVLVSQVLPDTPAAAAGVAVGDLILSVDGRSVATVDELREALHEADGRTFPVRVARERRAITLQVTIPEPQDDPPTGPRARLAVPTAPPAPPPPATRPAPPVRPAPPAPGLLPRAVAPPVAATSV